MVFTILGVIRHCENLKHLDNKSEIVFIKKNIKKFGFGYMFYNVLISFAVAFYLLSLGKDLNASQSLLTSAFYISYITTMYLGYLAILNIVTMKRVRDLTKKNAHLK